MFATLAVGLAIVVTGWLLSDSRAWTESPAPVIVGLLLAWMPAAIMVVLAIRRSRQSWGKYRL